MSTEISTKHPSIKGNKVRLNKGHQPFFKGEIITNYRNFFDEIQKPSPKQLNQFQPNLAQSILR